MNAQSQASVIVWFRQDLRLADNPALTAAAATGRPVIPVYVLDDDSAGEAAMGAASRAWLHRSLEALDCSLDGRLGVFSGKGDERIVALVKATGAVAVYLNRCYEPWRADRDRRLSERLSREGVDVRSSSGSLLFDPDAVAKPDGTPYRVFTPFYRRGCLGAAAPTREPLPAPQALRLCAAPGAMALADLGLKPSIPWDDGMVRAWAPGEAGALERLDRFIDTGLAGYQEGRNRPDRTHVSRLSPHLHFGEISPNQVWYALKPLERETRLARDVDTFLSELGWREFSYYLLHHWPDLPTANWQSKFDRFPWRDDAASLQLWQRGRTGYPIVDAGLRELWQTGYMHNRVRMIAASFLVKNLLIHWHHGERWFWDTLVDADLASNSASWQWVAGCGADAAPYFRVFNPVTQGKKFDPDGDYVRRFVPELAGIDGAGVHEPWKLPRKSRESIDYPEPLVELKASRERALAAFRSLPARAR